MRKVLIATIVAMVLFAVGAFAAALSLDSEGIASGEAEVVACDETPEVNFKVGAYSGGDWPITHVTVTTEGCANTTAVEVKLLDEAGSTVLGTATGTITGGTTGEMPVTGTAGANPTENYAVLLNGDPV